MKPICLFGLLALGALPPLLSCKATRLESDHAEHRFVPVTSASMMVLRPNGIADERHYKNSVLPSDWPLGDCTLAAGSEVRFYDDGTATFSGSASTRTPGKVWTQDHAAKDSSNGTLFSGPQRTCKAGASPAACDGQSLSYSGADKLAAMVSVDWSAKCEPQK